jgi:hypothetical protein
MSGCAIRCQAAGGIGTQATDTGTELLPPSTAGSGARRTDRQGVRRKNADLAERVRGCRQLAAKLPPAARRPIRRATPELGTASHHRRGEARCRYDDGELHPTSLSLRGIERAD